jgi:hypothetical protein
MVDNAANGADDVALTLEELHRNVEANRHQLLADVNAVLPHLVAAGRGRNAP